MTQYVVRNPATLEPVSAVPQCGPEEVAEAVRAARAALTDWCRRPLIERAALIEQAGRTMLGRAAQLAAIQSQETGQAYRESLDCALAASACFTRAAALATDARTVAAGTSPCAGAVAVAVAPEYPLLSWAAAVAPLLVSGATVICAPPHDTPLCVLAAGGCLDRLPPGVVNIITVNESLTPLLSAHSGVDRAVIAGPDGTRPGDCEATAAPETRDCIFVARTADLDLALAGAASLRLFHSGQRPGQSARIYVEQPLAFTFADRLHETMAFLECGDPAKPITDIGPLSSLQALRRVEEQVARALKHGALLKLGGRGYQPWGLVGHFFQPTLMVEGRDHERVPYDRIAGPVIIVSPAEGIGKAFHKRREHESSSGLRVSVFADDLGRQLQSLQEAGFEVGVTDYAGPLERACTPAARRDGNSHRIEIQHVAHRRPEWFPYRLRSGS